jgi:hypothetical protein
LSDVASTFESCFAEVFGYDGVLVDA